MAVDKRGIRLGTVTAPASSHDSSLLFETLVAVAETLGELTEQVSVHLDRGYDSKLTRQLLEEGGLLAEISQKGKFMAQRSQKACVVYGASGARDGLLDSLLGRNHHRAEAYPRRLGPLPLGDTTFSQAMTYWRKLLYESKTQTKLLYTKFVRFLYRVLKCLNDANSEAGEG